MNTNETLPSARKITTEPDFGISAATWMCGAGPTGTLESTLMGECIECNDFLRHIAESTQISNNDLEPYLDSNNAVSYKKKKHSRKILNSSMWSDAWVK